MSSLPPATSKKSGNQLRSVDPKPRLRVSLLFAGTGDDVDCVRETSGREYDPVLIVRGTRSTFRVSVSSVGGHDNLETIAKTLTLGACQYLSERRIDRFRQQGKNIENLVDLDNTRGGRNVEACIGQSHLCSCF
jgi:hypothetical protein